MEWLAAALIVGYLILLEERARKAKALEKRLADLERGLLGGP
jgi:hypothetical protein